MTKKRVYGHTASHKEIDDEMIAKAVEEASVNEMVVPPAPLPAGEPFDEQPVPEGPRAAIVAARRIL